MILATENHLAAQSKFNQLYGTEQDYKRLWYLNIQYIQSWVHSDTATYDKLLWAEDFVHQSGANGYLYPKKEIMPIFGEKRFEGIEYFFADDTQILFITDSVAMILSRPLYYGKGDQYQKIMQANGLKSPDGIEEGKVLVIKDYRFGEDAKFLAKRYQELSEKREKLLQNKKSEPSTVKPVEKSAKKKDPHTTLKTLDIEHPARSASQELGN